MTETQSLLNKISALRQRLQQAQSLAGEAGSALAALVLPNDESTSRVHRLQSQIDAGAQQDVLLNDLVRHLAPPSSNGVKVLPAQLTGRARRILEQGRELLAQLRSLAEFLDQTETVPHELDEPVSEKSSSGVDPYFEVLSYTYRETAAMANATLRMVQAFPDSPSAQMCLCEGFEATLNVVAQRIALLNDKVTQHRLENERIERLARLLTELSQNGTGDVAPFLHLAEELAADAESSTPLKFFHESPQQPARFIACHSLTVAQVAARAIRHDPEFRGRQIEPVVAALIHDVGMLQTPVEILTQPSYLEPNQRRLVEKHTLIGAEWAAKLSPSSSWLVEAVAGHHERVDGTGYPSGLRDSQIAPLTRLLSVCDIYASLCTPRPYRPARETRTALTDTLLMAEQGALDRQQAERLLQLSFYPVGSVVELADGAIGVVAAVHASRRELNAPARPVVALLIDSQGRSLPAARHIDLAQSDSRSIVRALTADDRCQLLGKRHPEWV